MGTIQEPGSGLNDSAYQKQSKRWEAISAWESLTQYYYIYALIQAHSTLYFWFPKHSEKERLERVSSLIQEKNSQIPADQCLCSIFTFHSIHSFPQTLSSGPHPLYRQFAETNGLCRISDYSCGGYMLKKSTAGITEVWLTVLSVE